MQSNLFDTVPGFDWKHLKSDTTTRYADYIDHRKRLLETLTRLEDTNQKCFKVVAEGFTSYGRRDNIFCVFPTVIIRYVSDPCIPNWYDIMFHSLGSHALQCFKLSKLSENQTIHNVVQIFQSFDASIQKQFELSNQEMEERMEALETELAKYKGIVENCRKEISSYGF